MNRQQPASRVRQLVVSVTSLAAILLYLHRFCISYTQRYIKEDLGLSDDQFAWCLSVFFIAYALGQVPAGWLSDRFGARRMLTAYILAWSAMTACMGAVAGFWMLLLIRVAVGLSQAGAYPTSAALLGRWVPFASRGRANSLVAIGGRVGGFIAPLLTTYLVIAFVPADTSPKLSADDLLDLRKLASQLTEPSLTVGPVNEAPDEKALREGRVRVAARLTPEARLAAHALSENPDRQPADSVGVLLEALNRLIDDGQLYQAELFSELRLEREARQLAARQSRSVDETQRLNRFLLETLFPDSIRKLYVHGWRQVMMVYGGLGIAVAVVFWLLMRDRPEEHPRCNAAERLLIESGRPMISAGQRAASGLPVRAVLNSRSLWLMCVNQFGGNVGWVFLMTWLPRYLWEVHRVPFVERGWMAALPLSLGWIGMLTGGWLTDLAVRQRGLRWRAAPIVLGRLVAAGAYLFCLAAPNAWSATAAFALIAFASDMCNPASWSYKQDVGGRFVGAIHGWANMWGNFGAALSPVLLQVVIRSHGWNAAFITGATAFAIAGVAALGVDARIPIDQPDDGHAK